MSTPEIIGPVIYCQTPAELATLSVAPFLSGQHASVKTMRAGAGAAEYILQPAVSTLPDAVFVVPTLDDSSRQWVHSSIQEQGILACYTQEIDFTVAPQTIIVFPPLNYRIGNLLAINQVLTARDGTVTTGPTVQAGTNNSSDDMITSSVQSTLATANVGARNAPVGAVAGVNDLNLATNGVKYIITAAAVLGTATKFKGKLLSDWVLSRG
jgi:hypothetical protein